MANQLQVRAVDLALAEDAPVTAWGALTTAFGTAAPVYKGNVGGRAAVLFNNGGLRTGSTAHGAVYTVYALAYFDETYGSARTLVARYNSGGPEREYQLKVTPHATTGVPLPQASVFAGWSGSVHPSAPTVEASLDAWHVIALSRNGEAFSLYLDGVLVLSWTRTGAVGATTGTWVGGHASGEYLFHTALAEVRITDTADAQATVQAVTAELLAPPVGALTAEVASTTLERRVTLTASGGAPPYSVTSATVTDGPALPVDIEGMVLVIADDPDRTDPVTVTAVVADSDGGATASVAVVLEAGGGAVVLDDPLLWLDGAWR